MPPLHYLVSRIQPNLRLQQTLYVGGMYICHPNVHALALRAFYVKCLHFFLVSAAESQSVWRLVEISESCSVPSYD